MLVLYHLEWQQCLWASWNFSLEMTWQQQLSHSFNDQEQAPMLPEGGTLRVQRKRGKVSLSERDQSTKWEWSKNGGKLTWQSATNSKHENERRGKEEEGTRAREMLEEWGNSRSKLHRSINQTTVIRSDAPQEEIEKDMICGVMQMSQGTKTITLHSNQQRGERIAKIKIQQKWLSYIKTDYQQGGKEGGFLRTSAAQCLVHCAAILVICVFL